MTDDSFACLMCGPSHAEKIELAQLRERFQSHHIFREAIIGRGIRYMAHSALPGARPHTIITDDLAELREVLEQTTPGSLPACVSIVSGQLKYKRWPPQLISSDLTARCGSSSSSLRTAKLLMIHVSQRETSVA